MINCRLLPAVSLVVSGENLSATMVTSISPLENAPARTTPTDRPIAPAPTTTARTGPEFGPPVVMITDQRGTVLESLLQQDTPVYLRYASENRRGAWHWELI